MYILRAVSVILDGKHRTADLFIQRLSIIKHLQIHPPLFLPDADPDPSLSLRQLVDPMLDCIFH